MLHVHMDGWCRSSLRTAASRIACATAESLKSQCASLVILYRNSENPVAKPSFT
jgi:hypothetical protein